MSVLSWLFGRKSKEEVGMAEVQDTAEGEQQQAVNGAEPVAAVDPAAAATSVGDQSPVTDEAANPDPAATAAVVDPASAQVADPAAPAAAAPTVAADPTAAAADPAAVDPAVAADPAAQEAAAQVTDPATDKATYKPKQGITLYEVANKKTSGLAKLERKFAARIDHIWAVIEHLGEEAEEDVIAFFERFPISR